MTATGGKRIAQCGCGALTATVSGDPVTVYGCSCIDCQRKSGSAFSYAAMFPSAAVTIAGERKTWRHNGDSGRWIENIFCPTCGDRRRLPLRRDAGPDRHSGRLFRRPGLRAAASGSIGRRAATAGSPCITA